ncbi:hypothetical protein AAFN85_19530 [Mucilaginibacter sp. CAU 1740]|jgi:hypothetical protein|uniref:hypothetical protein n=1 Tax=Mucilaginibacter sp. CAU 1740 TaxID=3140365 RepID=UPI00325AF41E
MDERSYLATWQKYMPVIRLHIKRSLTEDQQFKLNITDFESAGDKGKSGYMFNINIEDGKVTNKISTSAVARDLYELLKADEVIRGLFKDKNVKISVGKSFILAIKTTHLSTYR